MVRKYSWKKLLRFRKALRKKIARSRVASPKLRLILARVEGDLEKSLDMLARAQFLEGLFLGPGRQNEYYSRRRPPRQALKFLKSHIEDEYGAISERAEKTWFSLKNQKFFSKSWDPVDDVLEGQYMDSEDVLASMMAGLSVKGLPTQAQDPSFSVALYERLGQDSYKDVRLKSKLIQGDLTPKRVARWAAGRVKRRALGMLDLIQREQKDVTDTVSIGPHGPSSELEEVQEFEEQVSSGDVFDTAISTDQAMFDMFADGNPAATKMVEGLVRTIPNDQNAAIIALLFDTYKSKQHFEDFNEIYEAAAERVRRELGIPISPAKLNSLRKKTLSKYLKPGFGAASILADAMEEAGSSSMSLQEIMMDNLLDVNGMGPKLYDSMARAYTGSNRSLIWRSIKDLLVEGKEVFVSYEDFVSEVAQRSGKHPNKVDQFLQKLVTNLIALLEPVAKNLNDVEDQIQIKKDLDLGRIRAASLQKRAFNKLMLRARMLIASSKRRQRRMRQRMWN